MNDTDILTHSSDDTWKDLGRTAAQLTPTEVACRELQGAYTHFNRSLFDGELPEAMLTMDHKSKNALGYFRPQCFVSSDGSVIDQISMNPSILLDDDLPYVMSIVVHEMGHLWTHHFSGRKGKGGYHCRKWGRKLESIGLTPSNTGAPGGKKTGYQMMHYINEGGPFDEACKALLENGFAVTWGSAQQRSIGKGDPKSPKSESEKEKKKKSKGKIKFACPTCEKPCWAAPTRKLICGDDKTALIPVY